jgi:hypothetical protein
MRRTRLAAAAALLLCGPALAQTAPAALDNPDAFERGFALSLYQFDACGDPLAGLLFRRALNARFAQCPFSPAARTRYARRTAAEQAKVDERLRKLIEQRGGLPMRLEGMTMTCRQQQESPDYRALRARLEDFSAGRAPAQTIFPAPCDAAEIVP